MKRMMICSAAAAMMFSVQQATAVTPTLLQGTQALNVSGSLSDDGDDMNIALGGSYGRFVMDYLQAGAFMSANFIGSDFKMISGGLFGEYNLDMGDGIVPYVGGSAGLAWMDFHGNTETAVELTGFGGARYFFVDYAAVGAELVIKVATEDMYNGGEDAMDWEARVKTSWYF